VLRRVRELPGVEAAAVVQSIPLDGQRNFATVTIDGVVQDPSAEIPTIQGNTVSADYFSLMRIPVRRGRVFTASDTGALVAVINDEAARKIRADPVGRRLHWLTTRWRMSSSRRGERAERDSRSGRARWSTADTGVEPADGLVPEQAIHRRWP
jgi:hypothetical protein